MSIWKKNKSTIENIEEKKDMSKEILEEVSAELEIPIEKKSHDSEEVTENTTSEAKEEVEESIKAACNNIKLNAEDSTPSKTPRLDAWYARRYFKPKKALKEMYERLTDILGEDGVIEFVKDVIYTLDRYDIYGSIDAYRLFVIPKYSISEPYKSDLAMLCKMCFLYSVNSWDTHIKSSFLYDLVGYNNKSFEDIAFDMLSADYPDTYKGYMIGDNIGSNPGQSINEIRHRKIYHIEYNFAIDHVYLLAPPLTFNPRSNGTEYDTNMKVGGNNYEEIVMNFHEIEKTKSKVSHRPDVEVPDKERTILTR